ncbi:unnamed protein product [Umbelopsis ramanniana]
MKFSNILTFITLFALVIVCAHGLENPVNADKLTIEKDKLINNIKGVVLDGEELSQKVATDIQRDIDHFLNNVQDWRHITEASISQTLSSIRATLEQHNIPPKRVKEVLERVDGALLDFEAHLTTAQQSIMGTFAGHSQQRSPAFGPTFEIASKSCVALLLPKLHSNSTMRQTLNTSSM